MSTLLSSRDFGFTKVAFYLPFGLSSTRKLLFRSLELSNFFQGEDNPKDSALLFTCIQKNKSFRLVTFFDISFLTYFAFNFFLKLFLLVLVFLQVKV